MIKQLVEISTTPYQLKYNIRNAENRIKQPQPSYEMKRETKGLQMSTTPSQLTIDQYPCRASMGYKKVGDSIAEFAQKGNQAATDSVKQFVKEGEMLADSRNNAVPQIGYMRTQTTLDTMLGFLPSSPPEISFSPSRLNMQYEADKLVFDWRTQTTADLEFVPGHFNIDITQYGRIDFTYVGGPMYVPLSSDPNYNPPPALNATA